MEVPTLARDARRCIESNQRCRCLVFLVSHVHVQYAQLHLTSIHVQSRTARGTRHGLHFDTAEERGMHAKGQPNLRANSYTCDIRDTKLALRTERERAMRRDCTSLELESFWNSNFESQGFLLRFSVAYSWPYTTTTAFSRFSCYTWVL